MAKCSFVWKFFTEEVNDSAKCSICKKTYSRKGRGTSSLKNHLKSMHKAQFTEAMNEELQQKKEKAERLEREKKSASLQMENVIKQRNVEQFFPSTKFWNSSDIRSKKVDRRIAEMIVMDDLPFSHVEDVGFTRLISEVSPQYKLKQRKFYSSFICDKMFQSVFENIKKIVEKVMQESKLSFTTDIWSNPSAGVSLLSVTAHTINQEFERINFVLGAIPLEERHTGEYISTKFDEILGKWKISKEDIHCVMRDSGTNMKKALFLSGVNNLDCAVHKVQLVVKRGLESKIEISELISKCRSMSTHFRHSTMAQDELRKIQDQLKKPKLNIIHDTPTRWNSTLYMLKRIEELKESLRLYAASNSKIPLLTNFEWIILSGCVRSLEPFEEITKILSGSTCTIGDVIPLVASLKVTLQQCEESTDTSQQIESSTSLHNDLEKGKKIINSLAQTMLAEIERRFIELESDNKYRIATYLDPRYKGKFFPSTQITDQIKLSVAKLCDEHINKDKQSEKEPLRKRKRTDKHAPSTSKGASLTDTMALILASSSDDEEDLSVCLSRNIIEKYHKERRLEANEESLKWWKEKGEEFSPLGKVVRTYLSCPPGSVPSEQLFSSAGQIYDEKRMRLQGENAEKLLFLKYNLPLLKYKY
ncbi:UNVERIFIED_CONTAM: hypothetical protein RMT77_001948 [Armadillidium vulgare]